MRRAFINKTFISFFLLFSSFFFYFNPIQIYF